MRVELLWWEGCPSHPQALDELRDVLRAEGLDPDGVEVVEIESEEQAKREGFPGSPTIRLEGEDLLPPGEGEPAGLTCRIYHLRDGRPSPTPDPEDIRDAIRRIHAGHR